MTLKANRSSISERPNRIIAILFVALVLGLPLFVFGVFGQSGGTYSISHSVISNGGAQNGSGGTFAISGTVGQTATGNVSGGALTVVRNGFWHNEFAPTAAMATISGRIVTSNGNGIRNALVKVTDMQGNSSSTITGTFGYFLLSSLEVGQTYVISVTSKQFTITPRIVDLTDDISDIEFIALPF